jgi:NADH:ubiquinone oxidoreductase subunit E
VSATGSRRPVPRFGHGSRVPGWDEAVDLTKDPAVVPDLATTPVPAELRAEIEAAMAKYPDRRSAAIPALHATQRVHGWCSPEAIDQVAAVMQLTPAYLASVATFYDMFSTVPKGRHDVYVCTNISCSLRGADEFFEVMLAAAEGNPDVNVRSFECLGACDIAPMASVDGEYVGPLDLDDAARIVEDLDAGRSVLEHKQLRYRRSTDPGVPEEETDFSPPDRATTEMADTAGLGPEGDSVDRPGPTAAIELPEEQIEEADEDVGIEGDE